MSDPNNPEPSAESSVSELSKGWEITELRDIVETFQIIDPRKFPDDSFIYVDISSIDSQKQVISDPKTFLGKDAPSRARRVIKTETHFFNCAYLPEKYCIGFQTS